MFSRFSMVREKLGFSQKDLADSLGIQKSVVSEIESGKRELSKNVMISLMNKFNVSTDWLLTGEGEMFRGETKEVSQTYAKIPLLRQRVSCGPGKNWEDSDAVETYIEPLCLIPSFRNKNI